MTPGFSASLVESVDLYPTVAMAAGLARPGDVDGVDLSPLFANPAQQLKHAVFSEYPRCPSDLARPWTDTTSCVHTDRKDFAIMGCSVRTQDYRYTAWMHWDGANLKGDFTRPPFAEELYSHVGDVESDFDAFENVNLASDASHASVKAQMFATAKAHWDTGAEAPALLVGASSAPPSDKSSAEYRLQFEIWDDEASP